MAKATRSRSRSRTAKPKQEAETKAAAEAAEEQAKLDIAETTETAETPEPAAETETAETAETAETETAEKEETAGEREAREEAEFEAAVAKVGDDPIKASEGVKALHSVAVRSEEKLNTAVAAHRKRNKDSLETLKKVRVRLAAARTALAKEYKAEIDANQSTTTIPVEDANKPDVVYFDALAFDFNNDNDSAEKTFWLAAQRYMTVSGKVSAEPTEIGELRKAAEKAAADFNFADAAYTEAIKRAFGK